MHALTRRLTAIPLAAMLLLLPLLASCTTAPPPSPSPPPPAASVAAATTSDDNPDGESFSAAAGTVEHPRTPRSETAASRARATREANPSARTTPPANRTPSANPGTRLGPPTAYPDPTLTPGDLLPGVAGQETCVSGYAKSVRSVTSDEKAAVYQRYGIANVSGQHEVDHFIPLTLGGSNALTNLWPQPYTIPGATPNYGAHEKDKVETYLHEQVCRGSLTLAQAQNEMRTDWVAVYQRVRGA